MPHRRLMAEKLIKKGSSSPEILRDELDLKLALERKKTKISAIDGSVKVNFILKMYFSALGFLS
jgi:hypothetical protein